MMDTTEKPTAREIHLLTAAKDLVGLLHWWNVTKECDLTIENSATGTPCHHVNEALWKILLLLGVKNPDSKTDFCTLIMSGMEPVKAVKRIQDNEREDMGITSLDGHPTKSALSAPG